MRTFNNILYWAMIALLICFSGLYLRSCDSHPLRYGNDSPVLYKTDTLEIPGDPYPVLVYDSVPRSVAERPLERPAVINYDSLVQAFYMALSYADTVTQDSSFRIIYRLDISKNRLDSMKLFVQNLRPVALVTNQYIEPHKNALFLGGSIGGSRYHFNMAPSLMYQDKGSRMYQLQYDLINKQILAGLHFKIR
ncbi:MAG: hypothetical protein ACXWV4_09365 [Flavitalea sp.]